MVLDERMDADTDADEVASKGAHGPVVAPGCSNARFQIREKFNILEHVRCESEALEKSSGMILQPAESELAEVRELEEVPNSPKKYTSFEERLVWTEFLGTLNVDFCVPSISSVKFGIS